MNESQIPLSKKIFLYLLIAFNLLFISYIFTVGYYNRLALDDFAYTGLLRDYGFFNPFTYWYFNWQGRFMPQFFLNAMYLLTGATSNLLLYPALLSAIFIYSIYQILSFFFSLPKLILINYSILLFSALFLTTLERNTFYWMNASVMYFGNLAFGLLGITFLIRKRFGFIDYVCIAICFLYVGSSSENFGALACFLVLLSLVFLFFRTAYNFKQVSPHLKYLFSLPITRKLLTALFFCTVAFVIMIASPGTRIRMSQTQHLTDPVELIVKSSSFTLYICAHIFYRLPFVIVLIPLFIHFGSLLKSIKVEVTVNFISIIILSSTALLALIFISNLPIAYGLGHVGPLRSYVFVSFFLVVVMFLVCTYAGYRWQSRLWSNGVFSGISLAVLFVLVSYTFYAELPLLRKYNQSDRERISILKEHQQNNRTEPVYLPPLYNPQYTTISDGWRKLTGTDKFPSSISDMPVFIGDIGSDAGDWRNGHLKAGLGLKFDIYRVPGPATQAQ